MFAGSTNSVIAPPVVLRPMWAVALLSCLVNHSAPSEPEVIPYGPLFAVGVGYSVIAPPVVIRPILLAACSVNHYASSGPAVISPLLKSLFYRPGSTVTATTRMANPSGEAATRMIATAGPVSTNKR